MGTLCTKGLKCKTEVGGYAMEIRKLQSTNCVCERCNDIPATFDARVRKGRKTSTTKSCSDCIEYIVNNKI